MTHNEYNGWHNYETWAVNLWMSNDQGSDDFYRGIAQEAYDESTEELRADRSIIFTRDEVATRVFADRLKDDHEERQTESTGIAGVFADLLSGALSEVNWFEIAEHYIADVNKPAANRTESEEN